ncbi:hypothetical protein MLD38_022117 [Melastoma candidum]|uniref:Uncharacterized protein n=1 Tax=Melastoma candidum TaxID=119954 RepID=A0ACB9QHG7_9MYRT|nr:hypothetical protein MLD38_022117 [Melastoma candidum]
MNDNYTYPVMFSRLNFNLHLIAIPNLDNWVVITRRVKNVGPSGKYVARVKAPRGITIAVRPMELVSKEELEVLFRTKIWATAREYVFGSLVWSVRKHKERSPIAVMLLRSVLGVNSFNVKAENVTS